jgi:formylmethanofuran dehydrogenase subunit E
MSRTVAFVITSVLPLSGFAQTAAKVESDALSRVAGIHGAAGVFAVAGYRIGARALIELNYQRGSFALDVTHKTPLEVQWSCIADGIQAATGVSAGKLNLHIVETTRANLETVVRDKKTGRTLVFRLAPGFLQKYLDTPREHQASAAREVLTLPDSSIFSIEETKN